MFCCYFHEMYCLRYKSKVGHFVMNKSQRLEASSQTSSFPILVFESWYPLNETKAPGHVIPLPFTV